MREDSLCKLLLKSTLLFNKLLLSLLGLLLVHLMLEKLGILEGMLPKLNRFLKLLLDLELLLFL
jgi:hypothetical protein